MTNDSGLEGLLVTKLEVTRPLSAHGQVGVLDGNVLFIEADGDIGRGILRPEGP
jgi:hypothetical protein